MAVTPWWEALKLREEVSSGAGTIDDVQMSLHNAVYGTGSSRPPYAEAKYYGEITHPSTNLVQLMGRIAVRLGGSDRYTAAPALYHLDQAMGGGKSHGLIGLWHMAAHSAAMRTTEVGRQAFKAAEEIAGRSIPADLGRPQVVVLSCDCMTPGVRVQEYDGPATTLHERFLWRLFGRDYSLYERYAPHLDKDGLSRALAAVGRPILILVDEILDYVRHLSTSEHSDLAIKDMAFLRALLDVVNDVRHVAMLVVMIKSEMDPMELDAQAQLRRTEIEQLLVRNGTTATVTSSTDFRAILQRRLFDRMPAAEVVTATADRFLRTMDGTWESKVFAYLPRRTPVEFREAVQRCYPFHPTLIDVAEQEWAPVAGFQKVRSTIKIFAATAYALMQRARDEAWVPLLIGPGDLPLSSATVREAVIGSGVIADPRTQANYRQVAANDVVGDDDESGAARRLDRTRDPNCPFAETNPRAAERAATALFLYSIGGHRGQGRQGATEAELKAASFVPDASYGVGDGDTVLGELQDAERGLAAIERQPGHGGQPARLYLSTRQTLNMFFRAQRAAVSDEDRDAELAATADRLMTTGPFASEIFVDAVADGNANRTLRDVIGAAGIDDARKTRLVVLDPRRFSLLNGADEESRAAIEAALGIGRDKLPMQWAASAVFGVVNTQRRKTARGPASDYVAWKRVCDLEAVRTDPELMQQASDKRTEARRELDKKVKMAYQHVVYLASGEGGQGREMRDVRFELDNQTALDGTQVWSKLVESDKAFAAGEFGVQALLHNLNDEDYGRPLDELRDLFWSSPRMPLLFGGEADLQLAIFASINAGKLRLVGEDGTARVITQARDIGLGSATLRLARPVPATPAVEAQDAPETRPGAEYSSYRGIGRSTVRDVPVERVEEEDVLLSLTLRASLTDEERRGAVYDLIMALGSHVDSNASHVDATIKIMLPRPAAEEIERIAQRANASMNVTEL